MKIVKTKKDIQNLTNNELIINYKLLANKISYITPSEISEDTKRVFGYTVDEINSRFNVDVAEIMIEVSKTYLDIISLH